MSVVREVEARPADAIMTPSAADREAGGGPEAQGTESQGVQAPSTFRPQFTWQAARSVPDAERLDLIGRELGIVFEHVILNRGAVEPLA
jgi:hypothetical protein